LIDLLFKQCGLMFRHNLSLLSVLVSAKKLSPLLVANSISVDRSTALSFFAKNENFSVNL